MTDSSLKGLIVTSARVKDTSARSMSSGSILQLRSLPALAALFAVCFGYIIFHTFSFRDEGYTGHVREPSAVEEFPAQTGETVFETSEPLSIEPIYNDQSKNADYSTCPDKEKYRELYSLTRIDRKYYPVDLGHPSYNPNVIAHPTIRDVYVVVAQYEQYVETTIQPIIEWLCIAEFQGGALRCKSDAIVLPVEESIIGKCEGDLGYMNFRFGPRDGRVFYGPETPYIIYGSQGRHTCLSQWSQDFRMLTSDLNLKWPDSDAWYQNTTELSRPTAYGGFEKNFFFFWDFDNKTYVHNDIYPIRVFAEIDATGTVGEDLAPKSTMDGKCLDKLLPKVDESYNVESIHQATNSLSITLCKRSDPSCVPNEDNTYIMHIFQHKTFYDNHAIYESYIVLFKRTYPFAFYGIGQKPFWVTGRDFFTEKTHSAEWEHEQKEYPKGHTELFYVTSISWKGFGMKYHGFLDDVVFVNFGIEDSSSGTIDVRAEELLRDLELCEV